MKETDELVCIKCPLGCRLRLTVQGSKVLDVRGADCKIGEKYARQEFEDPRRVVTTTVRTRNGLLPVLPVRTEKPVPKGLVREIVRTLSRVEVVAPVESSQIIVENVLGTGVNIIASRSMPAAESSTAPS